MNVNVNLRLSAYFFMAIDFFFVASARRTARQNYRKHNLLSARLLSWSWTNPRWASNCGHSNWDNENGFDNKITKKTSLCFSSVRNQQKKNERYVEENVNAKKLAPKFCENRWQVVLCFYVFIVLSEPQKNMLYSFNLSRLLLYHQTKNSETYSKYPKRKW